MEGYITIHIFSDIKSLGFAFILFAFLINYLSTTKVERGKAFLIGHLASSTGLI